MSNRVEVFESIRAPFPADEDRPYLFISYSHRDRNRVFPVIRQLYEQGWRIWYDEGLEIGDRYDEVLRAHEENCAAVLLFLSENSVHSFYIRQHEIPQALEFGKPILICGMDGDVDMPGFDLSSCPRTDPAGLEELLSGVPLLERGAPREAMPRQVDISLAVAAKDSEYEFGRCQGGVRLLRYRGSDTVVRVPSEYPPGSGLKVVETSMTFFDQSGIEEVRFPPTLRTIGMATFGCVYLPGENTRVYVPSSVRRFEENWCGKLSINPVQKQLTFHCARGSTAFAEGSRRSWVTVVADPAMRVEERPEDRTYAYCSYAGADGKGIFQKLCRQDCAVMDCAQTDDSDRARRIAGAACFIAWIDRAYLAGDRLRELRAAYAMGKKISLYYLDDSELPEDLEPLGKIHSLKRRGGNEAELMTRLLNWLSAQGCRELSQIEDFEYIVEDNAVILTKYHGGPHAVIQPEYGGLPVRAIFPKAFSKCSQLLTVNIPDGLEVIGDEAFSFCENLQSIHLPDSVTEIGQEAFYGCVSLESVRLSERLTQLNHAAFMHCASVAKVRIPGSVRKIYSHVFADCKGLRELEIPDGVEELGASMVERCTGLFELVVPGSVKKISRLSLGNCPGLRRVILREGVREVEESAFLDSRNLVYVRIPQSVEILPDSAFICCCSLRVPVIPERILQRYRKKNVGGGQPQAASPGTDNPEPVTEQVRRIQRIRNPLRLYSIVRFSGKRTTQPEKIAAVRALRSERLLASILTHCNNLGVQVAAAEGIHSRKRLEELALEHDVEYVRMVAVKKLESQAVLERVAKGDENTDVRIAAVSRLTNRDTLIDISRSDPKASVRLAALERLNDAALFRKILRGTPGGAMRRRLIERIQDQLLLEELAVSDPYTLARETAVGRLNNTALLRQIAREDREPWIRRAAGRRLSSIQ